MSDDDYVAQKKRKLELDQQAKDEFKADYAAKMRAKPMPKNTTPVPPKSPEDKQAELKKSMDASRAKGVTFSGDPLTPEQEAATKERLARIQKNINADPSKVWDPYNTLKKKKPDGSS